MRRSGFTWIEAVVVVAILIVGAGLFLPATRSGGVRDGTPACFSNLRQLGLAFSQYAKDNNSKFPPQGTNLGEETFFSYVRNRDVFQCPQASGNQPQTTDYFTNARLARVKSNTIAFPSQTILAGDGMDDSPLDTSLSQLPAAWLQDPNSPARRHLGSASYAFVDGHLKWLKPDQISRQSPKSKSEMATFAIK